MFLPESAAIAAKHCEIVEVIEQIDQLIYDIGDHPIRPDVVADSLDVDERLLTRVLRLYSKEQVVREEERTYCSRCDSLVLDKDGCCDNCEVAFTVAQPRRIMVFTIVEPILRQDLTDEINT